MDSPVADVFGRLAEVLVGYHGGTWTVLAAIAAFEAWLGRRGIAIGVLLVIGPFRFLSSFEQNGQTLAGTIVHQSPTPFGRRGSQPRESRSSRTRVVSTAGRERRAVTLRLARGALGWGRWAILIEDVEQWADLEFPEHGVSQVPSPVDGVAVPAAVFRLCEVVLGE